MRVLLLTLLLTALGYFVMGLRPNDILNDFKTFWQPILVVPLIAVLIALVIDHFRD